MNGGIQPASPYSMAYAKARKISKERATQEEHDLWQRVANRAILGAYPDQVAVTASLGSFSRFNKLEAVLEINQWIDPEVIVAIRSLESISSAMRNPVAHIVKYWEMGEQFQRKIGAQEPFRADDLQRTVNVARTYRTLATSMEILSGGLPTPDDVCDFLRDRYELSS